MINELEPSGFYFYKIHEIENFEKSMPETYLVRFPDFCSIVIVTLTIFWDSPLWRPWNFAARGRHSWLLPKATTSLKSQNSAGGRFIYLWPEATRISKPHVPTKIGTYGQLTHWITVLAWCEGCTTSICLIRYFYLKQNRWLYFKLWNFFLNHTVLYSLLLFVYGHNQQNMCNGNEVLYFWRVLYMQFFRIEVHKFGLWIFLYFKNLTIHCFFFYYCRK